MGSSGEVEGGDHSSSLPRGLASLSGSLSDICWVQAAKDGQATDLNMNTGKVASSPQPRSTGGLGCCGGLASFLAWIWADFKMPHLICIKLVFLFQSASMTVLYPFLNLHMKSLGISVQETAVINAVIPILFIFTPPLAGLLADRVGNFRVLLSSLTAAGGLVSMLLLSIPTGRNTAAYPEKVGRRRRSCDTLS